VVDETQSIFPEQRLQLEKSLSFNGVKELTQISFPSALSRPCARTQQKLFVVGGDDSAAANVLVAKK